MAALKQEVIEALKEHTNLDYIEDEYFTIENGKIRPIIAAQPAIDNCVIKNTRLALVKAEVNLAIYKAKQAIELLNSQSISIDWSAIDLTLDTERTDYPNGFECFVSLDNMLASSKDDTPYLYEDGQSCNTTKLMNLFSQVPKTVDPIRNDGLITAAKKFSNAMAILTYTKKYLPEEAIKAIDNLKELPQAALSNEAEPANTSENIVAASSSHATILAQPDNSTPSITNDKGKSKAMHHSIKPKKASEHENHRYQALKVEPVVIACMMVHDYLYFILKRLHHLKDVPHYYSIYNISLDNAPFNQADFVEAVRIMGHAMGVSLEVERLTYGSMVCFLLKFPCYELEKVEAFCFAHQDATIETHQSFIANAPEKSKEDVTFDPLFQDNKLHFYFSNEAFTSDLRKTVLQKFIRSEDYINNNRTYKNMEAEEHRMFNYRGSLQAATLEGFEITVHRSGGFPNVGKVPFYILVIDDRNKYETPSEITGDYLRGLSSAVGEYNERGRGIVPQFLFLYAGCGDRYKEIKQAIEHQLETWEASDWGRVNSSEHVHHLEFREELPSSYYQCMLSNIIRFNLVARHPDPSTILEKTFSKVDTEKSEKPSEQFRNMMKLMLDCSHTSITEESLSDFEHLKKILLLSRLSYQLYEQPQELITEEDIPKDNNSNKTFIDNLYSIWKPRALFSVHPPAARDIERALKAVRMKDTSKAVPIDLFLDALGKLRQSYLISKPDNGGFERFLIEQVFFNEKTFQPEFILDNLAGLTNRINELTQGLQENSNKEESSPVAASSISSSQMKMRN